MIEALTAGIDWISCTLGKTEMDYHIWRADAYHALAMVAQEGYQLGPRRLLGYEGHSAGNCFVGENEHGSFAQFTGEKANWAFDYLYDVKVHISRLDLQITVKRDVMDNNEGKKAYNASMRANKAIPIGRRRKLWYISGSDGGYTFYLGSASSDERARIYNKEVQSEDLFYTRTWRYEVVYRNDVSTQLGRRIATSDASRADYCIQEVVTWLAKRGVHIPGVAHTTLPATPIERTRPTDVETKLKWLHEQVAPTVRYLTELGMRDLAMEMLGLNEQTET